MDDNRLSRSDVVCMAAVALLSITSFFLADNPDDSVVSRRFRQDTRQSAHHKPESTPRR